MRSPVSPRSLLRIAATIVAAALLAFAAPATADEPTPPAAPQITASPSSPANDLAPRWEFTSSDVVSFECSLSKDDVLVADWAACSSPAAYDVSAQADGTYVFAVRAVTPDGARSEAATSPYTLDTTTPPLPTITSLPGPVANNRSPQWSFSGGATESFECRLGGVADWAPCASPATFDLTGRPDGDHTFEVRGISADGATTGPSRTDVYRLDTTAPDAPEVTTPPPAIGDADSATLAFSAEPGAQVECRVEGATDWTACTSPYTFELGAVADGPQVLALRAIDSAGNTSASTTLEYELDTTPPDAPQVDEPVVDPASVLQPTFTFSEDPANSYECRFPSDSDAAWLPCTSPAHYDLTGEPDGDYPFEVRATDAAGNTGPPGTATYVLVRDPAAVALRSGPGVVGSSRQPRWTIDTAGGSGFVCSLTLDKTTVFSPSSCGSSRAYNLNTRPDGTYTFMVSAKGQTPATQQYELDSTPPQRPAVDAAPVSPAAERDPAWRFTGEDGAALECRITRGTTLVVNWTTCTNPKPFSLAGAPDGTYVMTVRARDAAGNASASATSSYALDTTAPATPTLSAAPAADAIDRSPTWTFAGDPGVTFTCMLTRDETVVATKSSCATAKTYNLSGAQPGTYKFTVRATDAAGNTSPAKTASYALAKSATTPNGSGDGATGDGSGSGTGSGSGNGAPAGSTPPTGAGGAAEPHSNGGFATGTTSGSPARPPAGATATTPGESQPGATGSGTATTGRGGVATRTSANADGKPATTDRVTPRKRERRGVTNKLNDAVDAITTGTANALTSDVGKVVFPTFLLIVLGGFLLVQGRIDRSDPKLAMAPIDADPDLEFVPPPTRR